MSISTYIYDYLQTHCDFGLHWGTQKMLQRREGRQKDSLTSWSWSWWSSTLGLQEDWSVSSISAWASKHRNAGTTAHLLWTEACASRRSARETDSWAGQEWARDTEKMPLFPCFPLAARLCSSLSEGEAVRCREESDAWFLCDLDVSVSQHSTRLWTIQPADCHLGHPKQPASSQLRRRSSTWSRCREVGGKWGQDENHAPWMKKGLFHSFTPMF